MADDNEFGPLFRAAVEQHVAAMSNEDFAKLTALRPPTDAASTRRAIATKAQQMWDTPRDHNGVIGSMAAAATTARIHNHPRQHPAPHSLTRRNRKWQPRQPHPSRSPSSTLQPKLTPPDTAPNSTRSKTRKTLNATEFSSNTDRKS